MSVDAAGDVALVEETDLTEDVAGDPEDDNTDKWYLRCFRIADPAIGHNKHQCRWSLKAKHATGGNAQFSGSVEDGDIQVKCAQLSTVVSARHQLTSCNGCCESKSGIIGGKAGKQTGFAFRNRFKELTPEVPTEEVEAEHATGKGEE